MTLYQVVKELEKIALTKDNINYAGEGDIYELNTLPDIDYSVFYITQNTHTGDIDDNTFSFNLYYIDRLTENKDNHLKIQSDGIIILKNIINEFNYTYPDEEINYPLQFQTFYQRFADDCAGVYVTVQIETESVLGLCEE